MDSLGMEREGESPSLYICTSSCLASESSSKTEGLSESVSRVTTQACDTSNIGGADVSANVRRKGKGNVGQDGGGRPFLLFLPFVVDCMWGMD